MRRWRVVRPDDASTGLAPQSAAKAASECMRWGLSPAVTSSVAATSVPTPRAPSSAGFASAHSALMATSSSATSAVRARWRRAKVRIATLVALSGSRLGPGRIAAHMVTRSSVSRSRQRSRSWSGAVMIIDRSWFDAWARALIAERRVVRRAQRRRRRCLRQRHGQAARTTISTAGDRDSRPWWCRTTRWPRSLRCRRPPRRHGHRCGCPRLR